MILTYQGPDGIAPTIYVSVDGGAQIALDASATTQGNLISAGYRWYTTTIPANGNIATVTVVFAGYQPIVGYVDLSATPARMANLDNLDAAISTRLAGNAYAAPDNTSISAIKAKTDNLPQSPAATGDIPSTSDIVSAVWTSTARTLTSFGTLVNDVTTAVWGATTRTLTSFGTLVVSVASAILATPANKLATDSSGRVTVGTNADKAGYELDNTSVAAVQSGLATGVNVTSAQNSIETAIGNIPTPPTTSAIAGAILANTSNKLTTDTNGRVAVIPAQDPTSALTAYGVAKEADLPNMNNIANDIISRLGGAKITVTTPIVNGGSVIDLIIGSSYYASEGSGIYFNVSGSTANWTGATVVLNIGNSVTLAGNIVNPSANPVQILFELPAATTAQFKAQQYPYSVKITFANGHINQDISGRVNFNAV